MKRFSGIREVSVGTRVVLEGGDHGEVVANTFLGQYSFEFDKEGWQDVGIGLLVRTDAGVLVFMDDVISEGGIDLVSPE